jgi:GNAT superfamily N-acetyltransferase
MTGTAQEILRFGRERLRVSPHVSDETLAHLTPFPSGAAVSSNAVSYVTGELAQRGFRAVVTSALPPSDQQPFLMAGFVVREHLHLLTRSLQSVPPRPGHAIRRGWRHDRSRVLRIDRAAFGDFWRLDEQGLDDALHATPAAVLRILAGPEGPAGYTVSGRAGPTGYLQRLAVDPRWQGRGYGRALVADSLRWMHRRGARAAVVNTQDVNHVALNLYRSAGFVEEPTGLDVLVYEL